MQSEQCLPPASSLEVLNMIVNAECTTLEVFILRTILNCLPKAQTRHTLQSAGISKSLLGMSLITGSLRQSSGTTEGRNMSSNRAPHFC